MIQMVGGREVEIPENVDGRIDVEEVRHQFGLTPIRILIEQLPDGSNRVLPGKGKVHMDPYSHLLDAPQLTRGR